MLLQNVTNAIYWFHPLTRRLNRSLAQAREEVCDNYVLSASDAPTYSRTLLTVAEMTRCSRPLPGTVGLFTSRWKLESRVAGLLDTRRDRMTKLSRRGMLLVASMSLLVLALVSAGTMTLAVADGPESTLKTIKTEATQTKESLERNIENSLLPSFVTEQHVINGRVLDADGAPVSNAKVVVGIADLERRGLEQVLPVTVVSGPNGDFALSYRLGQFISSERTISWEAWAQLKQQLRVVAKADGYGPTWRSADNIDAEEAVILTLPSEVRLSGRLVNIEGAPVAGARVQLDSLERAGMHLDPWLESLKHGEEFGQASQKHGLLSLSAYLLGGEQEYQTDAEGRFDISNIGEDQLVKLIVQGDGLAWQVLRMIARDMRPFPPT